MAHTLKKALTELTSSSAIRARLNQAVINVAAASKMRREAAELDKSKDDLKAGAMAGYGPEFTHAGFVATVGTSERESYDVKQAIADGVDLSKYRRTVCSYRVTVKAAP